MSTSSTTGADVSSTTRIPKAEIAGLKGALLKRIARKKLGEVPEPLGVMWHNLPVLKAFFGLSHKAEKWDACDPQLKSLAHMATAAVVGCSFCLDLGYFQAHNENEQLDVDKAREVPRWRESGLFTPLEREVLAYAEAMTHTPPTVTDEMSAGLLEQLGPAAVVELTAYIGAANMVGRSNATLGIKAQGFAAACGLPPLAAPSADPASPS
jgi:alkylhydroperoxidase family enzyme